VLNNCVYVIGFLNHIARLFDEDILIGTGWTAQETMKALAYSTLADLVHHVRLNLPLTELALAVDLFAKNIHDDTLMSSIQTMSCKLLLNLVENIKGKSDQENGNVSTVKFLLCICNNINMGGRVFPLKSLQMANQVKSVLTLSRQFSFP